MEQKHVTLGAIIGGILLIMGGEIVKINAWNEALTPSFIGGLILQTGGLLAAIFGALYTNKPGT